jgi:DNA-directed RNA polymerase I and III subunit RPAC1
MLRGQRLDIRMEAVKGLGHDHAKWSPVATAYYKMVPRVRLKGELKGELAETIRGACAVHVFDIEESAGTLKVEDESRCTLCGECVRILEDKPQLLDSERPDNYSKFMQPMETDLRKVYENDFVSVCQQTDRFVFFIESVGQYRADVLFGEALAIFHSKCTKILEALQNE